MDLDELECRTHEQIRELQEEYRKRLEPLQKILVDIHLARPMQPVTISKEQLDAMNEPHPRELTVPIR